MDRPRIASIVSGTAASVAAFLVVSQWNLLGTVLGAALVPVVGTLVSHLSLSVLEKLNERARARLRWATSVEGSREEAQMTPERPSRDGQAHEEARPRPQRETEAVSWWRRAVRLPVAQWTLVSVSCAALGVSVFAVATPDSAGETVIRERVIERTVEKTVTVTTEATGQVAVEPGGPASGTATSVTTAPVIPTDTTEGGGLEEDQAAEESPASTTVTTASPTGSSTESSGESSTDPAQPAEGASAADPPVSR